MMDATSDVLAEAIARRPRDERLWGTVTIVDGALITVKFADGGKGQVRATGKIPAVDNIVQVEFRQGALRIVGVSGGFA